MASNAMFEEWRVSPSYMTAMLLFLRFAVACEEFDRTLPGFMRRDHHCGDTWIPCGIGARSANYQFAANERGKLRDAVRSVGGIDSATMRDAEKSVNHMSFAAQCTLLEQMEREAAGQPPREGRDRGLD